MFKDLTYKKKNQLLLAAALLLALLCWYLGFRKSLDAYKLNKNLSEQILGSGNLTESSGYTADRLESINAAYNRFRVDSASWRSELWLRVSGIAPPGKYQLVYNSENGENSIADSLILSQNILVTGKFRDLVQLLQTAEGIRGIGYVSSVKLSKSKGPSMQTDPRLINMEIQFRAVSRSPVY